MGRVVSLLRRQGLWAVMKIIEQRFVYRAFRSYGFRISYSLFKILPIQRKILFASDSRGQLDGNLKFVYDELLRRGWDYTYVFALSPSIGRRKTYRELIRLAFHLATSRFILLDDFYPMVYPLKIRKKAELIQVWHAAGAFKKFGYSREIYTGHKRGINHRNYTKAIVSSRNVIPYYAEGFGISPERIIPCGVPRTDVFFDEGYRESVREKFFKQYPDLMSKKIILYAPTFRGSGESSAYFPFEVVDVDKLYEALSNEYAFLVKMHPFVKDRFPIPDAYQGFLLDFSQYREVNDLLFVADILVTDYSSVCFEYALLHRPMLFFAFDLEDYTTKRDFYFSYEDFVPGKIVRTTEEMVEAIKTRDFHTDMLDKFIEYFFDHVDGRSSARFVDMVMTGERGTARRMSAVRAKMVTRN
ncbi:CDP-glycerol glycerophosphotransferase family protein [Alicyclobacillus kakegawensis]|uniref:CDP-glycerol glycerophosphotransferase family protein n=1 Tax=Alicyclobacillus kakegawensis TaxID=392012 RepID=UPI00147027ED|nr:CDP-glycerol glycerophosphotransferase family protein [Alicyclobacillus kakegawensis]